MLRRHLPRAILGVAVVAAAAAGFPYLHREVFAVDDSARPASPPPASSRTVTSPVDFPTIVERYGPAVVNISVTSTEKPDSARVPDNIDPGDPFFQFFKRFAPEFQWPQGNMPRVIRGLGSGFIVSADGLILTNAHVVDGAGEVKVKLTDRREFKAKVLGVDARSDVALLRIAARSLPTVVLGDSSRVRAGEPVLAIGSPYGFESTATGGIVSAVSRPLPEDTFPFIQTDVAVNPGNSGGPLFNQDGQVIGINAQIYTQTGGYQGLSFAIPINVATKVEAQLLANGKVTRGRLGIGIQDVDQSLAQSFGLPRPAGALIDSVEPGSPAAASGLKPGDVVTQADNLTIESSADLASHIADLRPGTGTTLRVIRSREPLTVVVKVGLFEEKSASRQDEGSPANRLGLAVRPLNEAERRSNGLANGLVVEDASGAAARAGIEPGDVILSLNGTPIASREQLRGLAAKAGKQVALLILRDNARIFIPVELG
ncbi:Do family serine endopeptidase [Cupriavidus pinatubonensis]|uniref:Do family serine endopeptidase n=1 Tax=Cupriavidus pinatubonensis TaxID=248026 RepID=UPI003618D6A6